MKSRLTGWIAVAMVCGPACGLLLRSRLDPAAVTAALADFSLVTGAFLRLIKMLIAPLVFCTLSVGVARMRDSGSILRIGARTLGWFVFASLLSMVIGLGMAHRLHRGPGRAPPAAGALNPAHATPPGVADLLAHLIPSSIVQAMAANEILQVVLFSTLFGLAASRLGARVATLIDALEQASWVILELTGTVMAVAPFAVFAALAATVLSQGPGVLLAYAKFVGGFYLALLCLWAVLAAALFAAIGARARPLWSAIRSPVLVAFSTASSEAAYPRTLQRLEQFGVPPRIAAFVLPLGYSFNLDGSTMYCAFALLFIAQAYHIDLGLQQQIAMLLMLMVLSKGIAGVPRAALMVVAAALADFGLPEQGLALVLAVDHLLDMGRSATNVVGNAVAATLVANWEGELRSEPPLG